MRNIADIIIFLIHIKIIILLNKLAQKDEVKYLQISEEHANSREKNEI